MFLDFFLEVIERLRDPRDKGSLIVSGVIIVISFGPFSCEVFGHETKYESNSSIVVSEGLGIQAKVILNKHPPLVKIVGFSVKFGWSFAELSGVIVGLNILNVRGLMTSLLLESSSKSIRGC